MLLEKQQIRLALLKAARVLFSHQENLRKILSQTAYKEPTVSDTSVEGAAQEETTPETETGPKILMQQLMLVATQPSPVKAVFAREELEVKKKLKLIWHFLHHSSDPGF